MGTLGHSIIIRLPLKRREGSLAFFLINFGIVLSRKLQVLACWYKRGNTEDTSYLAYCCRIASVRRVLPRTSRIPLLRPLQLHCRTPAPCLRLNHSSHLQTLIKLIAYCSTTYRLRTITRVFFLWYELSGKQDLGRSATGRTQKRGPCFVLILLEMPLLSKLV